MNVLSLFSGIGGIELGLERAGMTTVGQVECDPYCLKVLEKHWPNVPRHDDVRTTAEWWRSTERPEVDVICGGFPCQDISLAGKGAGIQGERSGLWFAMADVVRALRPRYVVMENVAAIVNRGLDVILGTLAEIGYDCEWDCIPAKALGAPHRRDRWFGVAYAVRSGRWAGQGLFGGMGASERSQALADTEGPGLANGDAESHRSDRGIAGSERRGGTGRGAAWASEPDVGRVAHGVPARLDRLKGLGNAVVPQVAEYVGCCLMGWPS